MIRAAGIGEERRMALAKLVMPLSVSFAPSPAPSELSVSVTIHDIGETEAPRARNADRRFREGGR